MTLLITQVDWVELWRSGGLPAVLAILGVVGIVAGARWFKSTMESTLTDARKERDAARATLEAQANKYIESMTKLGDIQEKGFDEVLRELRTPRRK